ncbi:Hypothetical predicted protein, partial [Cloeon dipterum]
KTALKHAAKYMLNDIVDVLLSYKASVFAANKDGNSALNHMEPEFLEQKLNSYLQLSKKQSGNLVKSNVTVLILAFGFAFAFYVTTADCQKGNCDTSFNRVIFSIFRTLTMFAGGFETGNLQFERASYAGRIIFFIFVFLVPIVIVNLLRALAVSDMQRVKSGAEIIYLKSQIRFFHDVDSYVLKNIGKRGCHFKIARRFSKWMYKRTAILNNLHACFHGNRKVLQVDYNESKLNNQFGEVIRQAFIIAKKNKERDDKARREEKRSKIETSTAHRS